MVRGDDRWEVWLVPCKRALSGLYVNELDVPARLSIAGGGQLENPGVDQERSLALKCCEFSDLAVNVIFSLRPA
jgi:hypothetical protein